RLRPREVERTERLERAERFERFVVVADRHVARHDDRGRNVDGHRGLYVARAGEGPTGGQAKRHLGLRLCAVRNVDGDAAVRRRVVTPVAAALVTSTVVGAGVWFATRPVPPRVSRLSLASSGTAALSISGNDRDLAITPDGSRLVYVGNRGTQLFVRALDALEPVAVFTGAPHGPFVSPDGQWIGLMDGVASLKKVAVTGGLAVTLATLDGVSLGATWG